MIHETSVIYPDAKIGCNVEIGPMTIIYNNVVIEDNCKIGGHCELGIESSISNGSPLYISSGSHIRSGSVFYEGSKFGKNLVTGHKVTVRENVIAGDGLQLGTYTDIQGNNIFGEYVKMHSNVHVGQGCEIEDFVWLFPYVLIVNDPHPPSNIELFTKIEKFSVIGARALLMPGTIIQHDSLVAAQSVVSGTVKSGELVAGSPAKFICKTALIPLKDGSKKAAYPWRRHFHNGYPDDIINKWVEEFK